MADAQPQVTQFDAALLQGGETAPGGGKSDVSVGGVVLLSALAVILAILAVVALGLAVMGLWWLASHIPVPDAVKHLLVLLKLA